MKDEVVYVEDVIGVGLWSIWLLVNTSAFYPHIQFGASAGELLGQALVSPALYSHICAIF